jgi:hypothetical protein
MSAAPAAKTSERETMTSKATHPVEVGIMRYNVPRAKRTIRSAKKEVTVTVNRRGMTELDKILISNGGMGHLTLRRGKSLIGKPLKKARKYEARS